MKIAAKLTKKQKSKQLTERKLEQSLELREPQGHDSVCSSLWASHFKYMKYSNSLLGNQTDQGAHV